VGASGDFEGINSGPGDFEAIICGPGDLDRSGESLGSFEAMKGPGDLDLSGGNGD